MTVSVVRDAQEKPLVGHSIILSNNVKFTTKNPSAKLSRRSTAGSSMVSFQPCADAFSAGNWWDLPAVIRQGAAWESFGVPRETQL